MVECVACGSSEVAVKKTATPGIERETARCVACDAAGVKVTTYSGAVFGH